MKSSEKNTESAAQAFADRIISQARAEMMSKPAVKASPMDTLAALEERHNKFLQDKKLFEMSLGGRITRNVFLYNRFSSLDEISGQIADDLRILYRLNDETSANSFQRVCNRVCHNLKICEKGLAEVPDLAKLG